MLGVLTYATAYYLTLPQTYSSTSISSNGFYRNQNTMIVDFNKRNKDASGPEQVTASLENLSVHEGRAATVETVRDSDTESTLSTDSGLEKNFDDLAAESTCSCHACEAHLPSGPPPPPPFSRAPFRGPPPSATDMPPYPMGFNSTIPDMGFMSFPPPPPPFDRGRGPRHDSHGHRGGKHGPDGRGEGGWWKMFGLGAIPRPRVGEFHPQLGHPWLWEAERKQGRGLETEHSFHPRGPHGDHGRGGGHRGRGRGLHYHDGPPPPPRPHGPPPPFHEKPGHHGHHEHHGHHGRHGQHGHGAHHHLKRGVPPPGPARHVRGGPSDLIDIFPPTGMGGISIAM